MWDSILFGFLPYVLLTVGIVGTIYRYMNNRFSWSSLSAQFLENRILFFGSFPWHFGIVLVLLAHIIILLIPQTVLTWNTSPGRLYALEISGLTLGFLTLFGLVMFIYRRLTDSRVRAMTTSWDVLVLIVLAIQVVTGLGNAILYKWGSNWLAGAASPWVWSVIKFNPQVAYVANLPLVTKIHIFNAMIIILLIPFTRFVHFLAFVGPLKYMTRSYQLVRWYNRNPRTEAIRQYK
ncbi:MAG: respiratory nitrate reductase subunit gamma [Deltaproteobacteria bacterium]|nr:respiratory nitrate reductase subunit gamma [Deltaproteobacteria bacterium]